MLRVFIGPGHCNLFHYTSAQADKKWKTLRHILYTSPRSSDECVGVETGRGLGGGTF